MNTHKTGLTILVVDDEFIFRELNKRRIDDFLKERVCYNILTANGLEHALEIVAHKSIDLVFTDMFMNGRDDSGLCLADRIKSFNNNTKVFIVSNADLKHIKEKANGWYAHGCFQLPLCQKDLETAFRDFI
jgi:CheY-like chemotaxis protein